ncbi:glycosyltransferase, partial [Methanobrevibacter sp.]
FNAEKYLRRCIDSIINQTLDFNKIELIIIDDNSTDSTKNILKE